MILDDDDDNADITEIYRLKILCKRGHEILKMRTVKLYILTLDHPPPPPRFTSYMFDLCKLVPDYPLHLLKLNCFPTTYTIVIVSAY